MKKQLCVWMAILMLALTLLPCAIAADEGTEYAINKSTVDANSTCLSYDTSWQTTKYVGLRKNRTFIVPVTVAKDGVYQVEVSAAALTGRTYSFGVLAGTDLDTVVADTVYTVGATYTSSSGSRNANYAYTTVTDSMVLYAGNYYLKFKLDAISNNDLLTVNNIRLTQVEPPMDMSINNATYVADASAPADTYSGDSAYLTAKYIGLRENDYVTLPLPFGLAAGEYYVSLSAASLQPHKFTVRTADTLENLTAAQATSPIFGAGTSRTSAVANELIGKITVAETDKYIRFDLISIGNQDLMTVSEYKLYKTLPTKEIAETLNFAPDTAMLTDSASRLNRASAVIGAGKSVTFSVTAENTKTYQLGLAGKTAAETQEIAVTVNGETVETAPLAVSNGVCSGWLSAISLQAGENVITFTNSADSSLTVSRISIDSGWSLYASDFTALTEATDAIGDVYISMPENLTNVKTFAAFYCGDELVAFENINYASAVSENYSDITAVYDAVKFFLWEEGINRPMDTHKTVTVSEVTE